MNWMNVRQKEILSILLTTPGRPLLVQEIAEQVGCSEKTIRNDFKAIEIYLEEQTNAIFIRKPGLGVYIEINDHDKAQIYKSIQVNSSHEKKEEDTNRALHIAYELLMGKYPITSQELAAKHYVSKAIIKTDLDHIEKWLTQKGLKLLSKQKIGLSVNGTELEIRKALADLSELYRDNSNIGWQFLLKQFSSYEIEIVQSELKEYQLKHSLYFTDETNERLLIHILFMIRRTKLAQPIALPSEDLNMLMDKPEFESARNFLKKLEIIFVVHFSDQEIAYFTIHLLGGRFRRQHSNGRQENAEDHKLVGLVTNELMSKMTEVTRVDFINDDVLNEGLNLHLYSALNRIKYGLSVSNPMLNDIKKMYPYIFDTVIHVLEEINTMFSLSIPEEEAAYVTIHFQASIERIRQVRGIMQNAIIVCHMGIGMSQLLRAKIEQKIRSINIIDCIAKADLRDYLLEHKVDVIISTIALPTVMIPHIVVSPLLEGSEEKKLKDFILKLSSSRQNNSTLIQYIETSNIFLRQDSTHRFKVIEKLTNALFEGGFVDHSYGNSAILRERMSATAIGSGIAIPHGDPQLIRKPAIAVLTLEEPIEWGVENVSLVFMLAVPNQDQQTTKQLFRDLSVISERPELIKKLIETDSIEGFIGLLNQ